jgi:hypothetical protein
MEATAVVTFFDPFEQAWRNRTGEDFHQPRRRRGDAIAEGRALAISRQVEHVVYDHAGTLVSHLSYGD